MSDEASKSPSKTGSQSDTQVGAEPRARVDGSIQNWTSEKVLRWTSERFVREGFSSPRLDAELLLAESLELDRVGLYMDYFRPLIEEELAAFRALVKRRLSGEPVAYILGRREFWSLTLDVDPRVLIPRPDTELLVELGLKRMAALEAPRVLDLGTGSGAVAIVMAHERSDARVTATDVSADALEVATRNAERHEVSIEFLEGSLFEPVASKGLRFDLVLSNPPYVAESDLSQVDPHVLAFEPHEALLAGPDGLDVIRPLVAGATDVVVPGGFLIVEMAPDQTEMVAGLLNEDGRWDDVSIRRDLAGRQRCVEARRRDDGAKDDDRSDPRSVFPSIPSKETIIE